MLSLRDGNVGEVNALAPGIFTSEIAAARPSLSAADLDRSIVASTCSCEENFLLRSGFIFTLLLLARVGCTTGSPWAVGRKEPEL